MLPLIGLGIGLAAGVGNVVSNRRANERLEEMIRKNPAYQANPLANQRLGLAQQLLNSRMPGAVTLERNILSNQANTMAEVGRNATDGSQALAVGAGVQGQTNQAFQDLATQEGQDYYNRLNNLSSAQQGVINEGDKVYQDQIRRFQDLAKIRGAQIQNNQNLWKGIGNFGQGITAFEQQLMNGLLTSN